MSVPQSTGIQSYKNQKNINLAVAKVSMAKFRSFDKELIEYTYIRGSKQPLVFLPALGFDWTYWKKSIDYFVSRKHSVVAMTLRGHSPKRTKLKAISLEDHIKDLRGLIKRLKLKNPVFIGASLGGLVAASYSSGYPKRKCICINTPFKPLKEIQHRYVPFLASLVRTVAILTSFIRKKDFDISKSKVTNSLFLIIKGSFKLDYAGVQLNYNCLKNNKGVRPAGIITISSRDDEVLKHPEKPDFEVNGNHHCPISKAETINKLLEKIINS